ncbi:MAG: hypothetical protein ACFFCZ_11180 [Promethearchaeota archaeon]
MSWSQSPTDSLADQWACGVICKGNGLISPRGTEQHGLVKSMLHEELKNAPWNASLVPSSVSGQLNREATLSAATKYWRVTWAKRTDPTLRCWGQDLRVPARSVFWQECSCPRLSDTKEHM